MVEPNDYRDWQAARQQREDEAKDVAEQATGFDLPVSIKRLALTQKVCVACGGSGQQPMLLCQTCGGTGRILKEKP